MQSPKKVKFNISNQPSKKTVFFPSIGSTISNFPSNPNIYYERLHTYSELTNQGLINIVNNNFSEALEAYEKALLLSEEMMDEYKKNESKCNIGIVHFYLGKITETINLIQPCYDYIYSVCSVEIGNNSIKNLYLLCKSGANLSMCLLVINSDNNNCLIIINNILDIISKEENIYKQLFCIQYLNNILFKVNSLLNINYNLSSDLLYINKYELNYPNINTNEAEFQNINKFMIESFDKFLLDQKIEPWINSLKILCQKIEQLNDSSGLVYIIFNQQMAICLKNDKNPNNVPINLLNNGEVIDAKSKLSSLLEAVNQVNSNNENNDDNFDNIQEQPQINDEFLNIIIEDYKSKLFIIRKIYQMLYSFEDEICSNIPQEDFYENQNIVFDNFKKKYNFPFNLNSEYYLLLLLQYTINYFNENIRDFQLRNDLINDINNTINLIQSKKIDISKINLSCFDPEISQALTTLLNELFNIYRKNKLKKYFKKLKLRTKKKRTLKSNSKVLQFLEDCYYHIYKGEKIIKINYHSSGTKTHFYQIDNENDLFEVFNENNSKSPTKTYEFDDIMKVLVGCKTKNMITKLNKLNIQNKNCPYLFMSLVHRKRTIDLFYNNEVSAKKWFYGLFYYFNISERSYKINSCTKYILFRLKCKMINRLGLDITQANDYHFSYCLLHYFKK
jgi:hypothetical protein